MDREALAGSSKAGEVELHAARGGLLYGVTHDE
jgi:hypothetical protein